MAMEGGRGIPISAHLPMSMRPGLGVHGTVVKLGSYHPLLHLPVGLGKFLECCVKLWYAFNTSLSCVLLSEQAFLKQLESDSKKAHYLMNYT